MSAAGNSLEPGEDAGFTLVEIIVVTMVLLVFLAIAGSAIASLTVTANRNTSMVVQEQNTSSTMAQLTADIRSATGLSFPAGISPSNEIELQEVDPVTGTATEVFWVYNSSTETLTRRQQSSNGTWYSGGFSLAGMANTSSEPVFAFFDDSGSSLPGDSILPIPSAEAPSVASNATAITVSLYVSSTSSGVANYYESDEVAMTNQVNSLLPAGQGT